MTPGLLLDLFNNEGSKIKNDIILMIWCFLGSVMMTGCDKKSSELASKEYVNNFDEVIGRAVKANSFAIQSLSNMMESLQKDVAELKWKVKSKKIIDSEKMMLDNKISYIEKDIAEIKTELSSSLRRR